MKFKPLLLSLLGGGVGAMMIAATMPEKAMVERSEATANALEEALPVGAENLSVPQNRTHSKQVAMTANELYGEWILTYTSAISSRPYPGGHALEISPIAGTDSVQFSKWYFTNMPGPKGKADLAKGTIFIPTQYVGRGKNGNDSVDVWFAPRLSGGGPNWQDGGGVTLTMKGDGNFSIDTQYGWGLFIYNTTSGYQWTSATGAGTLYKPNGTMKYAKNDKPNDTIVTPVYMKQTGGTVTVTNFYDVGTNVDFQLKSDSTISVTDQLAYQNTTAAYYLVYISKYDSTTGNITYNKSFTTLKSSNPNEILLPPWSLFGTTSTGGGSWFGLYDWAEISGDITFTYPMEIGLNGSGTQASPYEIGSVEDWNKFAAYTKLSSGEGEYFKLTADIDFGGKDCKMACEQPFKGTLLGNEKNLKGFTITTEEDTVGLMRRLDKGAYVEKVIITGSLTTSGRCAGTLAGKAVGASFSSITIGSAATHATLTSNYPAKAVSDYTSTGGVIGYAGNGCQLNSVDNYADISAKSGGVGGIIGVGGMGLSFSNCFNYGTVNITSTATVKAQCIGGFAGSLHPSTFIGCQNKGAITGDTNTEFIAGMVGQAQSGTGDTGDFLFSNCQNQATITGNGYVGGIIGTNSAGGTSTSKCVIENCVNTASGVIKSTATANNTSPLAGIAAALVKGATVKGCSNAAPVVGYNQYTGGIAGKTSNATEDMPLLVTECTNTGRVATQTYYAGGIIGNISAFNTVSKCFNTGDVDGLYGVGGVAGYVGSVSGTKPSSITDCVNGGRVTCLTNRTGGIVGNSQSSQLTFSGCVNTGNVMTLCENGGTQATQTSSANVSGFAIGGIAGITSGPMSNCVNFGSVKGVSRIGGITGQPSKNTSTFSNCINMGAIIAPNDTCGPIVGVNTDNTAAWTAGNSIKSCYYVDGATMNITEPVYANNLGEKLALSAIAGKSMDGMYTADAYTVPIGEGVKENPLAKLCAASVVPEDNETYSLIKTDFHVGLPSGLQWEASPATEITFEGTLAKISSTPFVGIVVLTARIGDMYKVLEIKVDRRDSGVASTSADIIEEAWYSTDGVRCNKPALRDGKVYIVVRRYADGLLKATKETF